MTHIHPHPASPPVADGSLPNGSGFVALLEAYRATGGTAPGDVVGRLLEHHRVGDVVSLARLICSGRVFGFEWRGCLWIPMFQFDADNLSLKAAVQRVRAELPPMASGWTLASWFAAPNPWLEGRRPADTLDADIEAVLRAARSLEPVRERAPPRVRRLHEVAAQV